MPLLMVNLVPLVGCRYSATIEKAHRLATTAVVALAGYAA